MLAWEIIKWQLGNNGKVKKESERLERIFPVIMSHEARKLKCEGERKAQEAEVASTSISVINGTCYCFLLLVNCDQRLFIQQPNSF